MTDETPEAALADVEARIALHHAQLEPRRVLEVEARTLLSTLTRRRKHAQQRGVHTWEGAQRGALRMVTLAVGCTLMSIGAWALDPTWGTASLLLTVVVLSVEGLR